MKIDVGISDGQSPVAFVSPQRQPAVDFQVYQVPAEAMVVRTFASLSWWATEAVISRTPLRPVLQIATQLRDLTNEIQGWAQPGPALVSESLRIAPPTKSRPAGFEACQCEKLTPVS